MRTTLDIDPALLKTAVRVLGTGSKRETVETALRESIASRRRRKLAESLGTFDFTLTAEEIHHLRERDPKRDPQRRRHYFTATTTTR